MLEHKFNGVGPLPCEIKAILDAWHSSQTLLPVVVRWKDFHEHQGTRRQDTLQHTHSAGVFATLMYLRFLELGVRLDAFLFLTAIKFHDTPEGLKHRDILLPRKTNQDDLDEYLAFVDHYREVPGFDTLHQAYLLQLCLQPPEVLEQYPNEAQAIMRYLRAYRRVEALAFSALERLDYLLYAVEQYVALGNPHVMANVMKNNLPKLDALVRELPAVGVYWSPQYIRWCKAVAALGNPEIPVAKVA